ncbi:hypothetical protein, partial [Ventosimonas gracilis]|uniref:hypothetical protein n=1 Tax=Ventosimonas gracilis TaxID=1680762 RepID=UPI00128F05C3
MATNNDSSMQFDAVFNRISSRGQDWLKHVEKHARPGESWAQADERLSREKEIAEAAAATLAPPEPATGQKSQQERPEETPEAPSSHFVADTRGAEIKDDIASME